MKLLFSIVFLTASSLAYSAFTEKIPALSLHMKVADVILSNSTSRTCQQQVLGQASDPNDQNGLSAPIGTFVVEWPGDQPLVVTSAHFELTGEQIENGSVDLALSAQEIGFLFNGEDSPVTIPARSKIYSNKACLFTLGGIQLLDSSHSTSGSITLVIEGTSVVAGENVAVSTREVSTYRYEASP